MKSQQTNHNSQIKITYKNPPVFLFGSQNAKAETETLCCCKPLRLNSYNTPSLGHMVRTRKRVSGVKRGANEWRDSPCVDEILSQSHRFCSARYGNGPLRAAFTILAIRDADHGAAYLPIISQWKRKAHIKYAINSVISFYVNDTILSYPPPLPSPSPPTSIPVVLTSAYTIWVMQEQHNSWHLWRIMFLWQQ